MKIKVQLLEQDNSYLERISSVFTNKFAQEMELYAFTDADAARANLEKNKIDVFVAADSFDLDDAHLPAGCGFAYLVESNDIETLRGHRAIGKYQKVDAIYKTILEIFAEHVPESIGLKTASDSSARVLAFTSVGGGTGSSCVAAACAGSLAAAGRRVLYLNLEAFGAADTYFSGEGQTGFSDIIFALKSKNANVGFKLESCVRRDEATGVCYFSAAKSALDLMELNDEELSQLLRELKLSGGYDAIVLDLTFSLRPEVLCLLRAAAELVFVLDGSETADSKFTRACDAMNTLDAGLLAHAAIFYNRFSNKTGKTSASALRVIGGAPRYENASTAQVITQLVGLGVLGQL